MREIAYAQANDYAYYYMGKCIHLHEEVRCSKCRALTHGVYRLLYPQLRKDAIQGQFSTAIHFR